MSVSLFVCFCKQETAYEMRISDWSSDVCSSDLQFAMLNPVASRVGERRPSATISNGAASLVPSASVSVTPCASIARDTTAAGIESPASGARSEEHTSELQSLMRISYAVFCLKKKKKKQKQTNTKNTNRQYKINQKETHHRITHENKN